MIVYSYGKSKLDRLEIYVNFDVGSICEIACGGAVSLSFFDLTSP